MENHPVPCLKSDQRSQRPWRAGATIDNPALEVGKLRPGVGTGLKGGVQEPRPELGITHAEADIQAQWGWEGVAMAFGSGVNSGRQGTWVQGLG